ncbi:hypothetical protein GJ688_14680 [Heliobacillus mobilis]|uniref:Uncharacterized protein n=1 Tax=Heliobacterium mobile TaxID=28064 RepID=A0A6I3SMS8_HELMO|nr:hypothetical protein [Heliobacterium mobile]MTV50219.1 hypothetical protein [Heliobacterium mobile]
MSELESVKKSSEAKPSVKSDNYVTQNRQTNINGIIQMASFNPNLLTPQHILQLQRTIGNRAVLQLLTQKPVQAVEQVKEEEEEPVQGKFETVPINDDPSLEQEADVMGAKALQFVPQLKQPVIQNQMDFAQTQKKEIVQCAKLNLRKENKTISGVSNFPSRPTSNLSGTQGQHLTAYVTFEDMILNNVRDKDVPGAAAALVEILNNISELPGMKLKSAQYLIPYIKSTISTLKTNADDAEKIGECIDTILSIRNKVPGTAERGTGGGHGESKYSGELVELETVLQRKEWKKSWDEDRVEQQCLYSMWRLLDYDPSEPKDEDDFENIATKTLTHFLTLRMAYPATFEWLTQRKSYLFTYLEANRDTSGMPFPRLKPKTVDLLRDYVHPKL